MKKILFLFTFVLIIPSLRAQEIEISSIFASSSSKMYKNSFGYSLAYSQTVKTKNRFGISFLQYSYGASYDNIYTPEYAPSSLSITETDANNKRFAIKVNYAFGLVNNPKSKLYLGPEIGLNYFWINEHTERIANGIIESANYTDDYWVDNRLGIGLLLEFQFDEVISKRVSAVVSVNPEFTSFEEIGTMGGADPYFVGWLNFKLGVRYKLTKE